MSCKACGQPFGCDHSDAEYQGVVPAPLVNQRGCPNCATPLLLAPGIGLFCPNAKCPVADGPDIWPNSLSIRVELRAFGEQIT